MNEQEQLSLTSAAHFAYRILYKQKNRDLSGDSSKACAKLREALEPTRLAIKDV